MSFAHATPATAVPETVRRRRAWGAAAASLLVILGLAVAILAATFGASPARPDPTEATRAGLPDAVLASLDAHDAHDTRCRSWDADGGVGEGMGPCTVRRRPPPAPPRPADATIVLPQGHPYHRWQIACGSTSTPPPVSSRPIDKGTSVVVIPDVPPVTCRVTLAGPGSPPVYVRAGQRVTCRLEGNLICAK